MEAVGSIKAHEVKAADAVMPADKSALQKQEETRDQNVRKLPERIVEERPAAAEEGRAKIERIAAAMDKYVKSIQRELDIRIDKESGKVVVKVLSRETGEVIREIPPEELLNLASKMEEVAGVLLNKSA